MTCPVLPSHPSGPKLFGEEACPPRDSDHSLPNSQICTNLGPQEWLSTEVASLQPLSWLLGSLGSTRGQRSQERVPVRVRPLEAGPLGVWASPVGFGEEGVDSGY